jgi:ribosomal protein S30
VGRVRRLTPKVEHSEQKKATGRPKKRVAYNTVHEETPEAQAKNIEKQENNRLKKIDNTERDMNFHLDVKHPSNTKKPKQLQHKHEFYTQRGEIQNIGESADDGWIIARRKKQSCTT